MTAPLKIAVTGATGMLGANIVKHALEAGHRVRALKRPTSRLDACEGLEPEWVEADVSDPASLQRAFQGQDIVIHAAALVAFWPGMLKKAFEANVIGTRNVVTACLACKTQRLIHTSTISCISIGLSPEDRVTEESPYAKEREKLVYHNTKRLAEEEVRAGIKKGLSACFINPSLIFGERDVNLNASRILREARRGALIYMDGGTSVCDADEVAKAHLTAIEKGRDGNRYVTGGENITNRQVVEIAAEVVGAKRTKAAVKVPAGVIFTLGWAADLVSYAIGKELLISSGVAADATLYAWTDSSKAQRELGYRIPGARVSMGKAFRWLRERGRI